MKKIVAMIAAAVLAVFAAGCSAEESNHIPNTFPMKEEAINRVLAENGMPMIVKNFTEIPVDEIYGSSYNHNYILYDDKEVSYGQGSLQFIFGDVGNRVTFSYIFSVPGTTPSWKYHEKREAMEQGIAVACALYGGFENIEELADRIARDAEKDKLRYYNNQTVWYGMHEGVHVLVQFATKGEDSWDDKLYFRSIRIADDDCFRTTLESSIEAGEKSSRPENYDWASDIYDEVYG